MADNVAYTPGSGAQIAADDVGGVLYQRVKPAFGTDGFAIDVSSSNPFPVQILGDIVDGLRAAISTLNRRTALNSVDASGRQRVLIDTTSSLNTVSTVTTVSTVSTVSTVTTVSTVSAVTQLNNMGQGLNTSELVRAMSRTAYNTGLRSKLSFS